MTKTLVIDEGASFKGNCTMEVMEEKKASENTREESSEEKGKKETKESDKEDK